MADIDDMIADLMAISENYPKAVQETNKKILSDALDKVKDKTPVDTGALKGDWDWDILDDTSGLLHNNMEYADDVEFGHSVRGKGKKKSGGKKNEKKSEKERKSRQDGKQKGSKVDGVHMLRDTKDELAANMDEYGKIFIEELGLEVGDA